jgi:hypothetical protein
MVDRDKSAPESFEMGKISDFFFSFFFLIFSWALQEETVKGPNIRGSSSFARPPSMRMNNTEKNGSRAPTSAGPTKLRVTPLLSFSLSRKSFKMFAHGVTHGGMYTTANPPRCWPPGGRGGFQGPKSIYPGGVLSLLPVLSQNMTKHIS